MTLPTGRADQSGYPISEDASQDIRRRPEIPTGPELLQLEGATILARVGKEIILAGEITGVVDAILDQNADQIPPGQRERYREELIRNSLNQMIMQKLVFSDFRRNIPEENYPLVLEKIGAAFEESEVERLMESSGARSRAELEEQLAAIGSSLERKKRSFVETMVVRQMIQEEITVEDEITHAEMLEYYSAHRDEFAIQAKYRWQHLMVRFDRHPSREAAWQRLAELGNRILSGHSFENVAREASEGPTAADGGNRDWTTAGSLVSEDLNRALLTLPPGVPSRILEEKRGLHIVRVLERQDAGWVPFLEAQVDIKDKIRQQRENGRGEEYLAKLRERTLIWTIFDELDQSDTATRPGAAAARY